MRDYLNQFIGAGGNPWYGAAKGATIGTRFGLVLGVGMQDGGGYGHPERKGLPRRQTAALDAWSQPNQGVVRRSELAGVGFTSQAIRPAEIL